MTDNKRDWTEAFLARIFALAPVGNEVSWDRATLAHLRHSLGRDLAHVLLRAGRLFSPVPDFALEDAALIASLFATHPARGKGSLGESLRHLIALTESQSLENRFVALVDSDKADLPARLRQIVSLLKAKELAIDWPLLLEHLRHWDHESRWVQKKWARDFWAETMSAAETETTPLPTTA